MCVVGAAVVLPVVVLERIGQALADRCEGAGGVYTPEPSEAWPHIQAYPAQWTCEGAEI